MKKIYESSTAPNGKCVGCGYISRPSGGYYYKGTDTTVVTYHCASCSIPFKKTFEYKILEFVDKTEK